MDKFTLAIKTVQKLRKMTPADIEEAKKQLEAWSGLYENGCYMLKDNSQCISGEKTGFESVEQYIKEHSK